MSKVESPFRQLLNFLDTARSIVLNTLFVLFMVFLLLIFAAIGGLMQGEPPVSIPDGGALVLAPQGMLVEEYSGDAVERAIGKALGDGVPQVRHRDLLDAIAFGAEDKRIQALVVDFDGLVGGGPAMYEDLAEVIGKFRESGKTVFALGDAYDQGAYFAAAQADEVFMHPMGIVYVRGYGIYRNYFRGLLDEFDVDWNVFHAGEYKSYGEPYTRDSMSEEAKQANLAFLSDLWNVYQSGVEAARQLEPGTVEAYTQALLSTSDSGDFAQKAVEFGFVDALLTRDEMRARVADVVGENGDGSYRGVGFADYVNAMRLDRQLAAASRPQIAVIVAEGSIVTGDEPPGVIAAERISQQIRNARLNDDVKAVVMRVNSGGGSAFASDLILRELELLQASGKPLVVSMGTVAASGGYWISMSADEIWARPATITGSIGVVAMVPTFERTLDRFGVQTDGVGTTPLAGALRPDRSMSEDVKKTLQASVDHLYQVFLSKVSENRGMEVEAVDEVARGRVWSGIDAQEHGLVDKLGGFMDAVNAAAELAGLEEYALQYVEPELSFADRLLINLFNSAAPALKQRGFGGSFESLPVMQRLRAQMQQLQALDDPRGLYYMCFCELP